MKEMTIEQKAKAYDNAYKKVAVRFGSNVADEIFPEHKKFEDDDIRKWLIGYFNQYIIDGMPQVFGNGLNVKDVIAWLEKQEEPLSKVWHYQKNEPVDEITDKSRPIIVVYGNNSLNAAGKFRYYENNSDAIWLSNSYEKWAFVEDLINLTHSITKEKPVSEDLGDYINELSKQFPEVSFAKLSRIAVRVAKWQQEKDSIR